MRIAIVGSRSYADMKAVREFVEGLPAGTVVVSGGADGVDTFAIDCARKRGLATEVYRADWKRYGRRAGIVRNAYMAGVVDHVAAFWNGNSAGTKHMITISRTAGLPVDVFKDRYNPIRGFNRYRPAPPPDREAL